MEEEKLEEAKKTFDEDCDKFNTYLEELENKASEAVDDVKKMTKVKNDR
jgi:ppGpp synthetase/RelA/SpoT-type nucleotidyltranferase